MTTNHTYIRCINKIYVGDAADQWRLLHNFETEQRAKRWQRDQEKNRPGSVTVGPLPKKVIMQTAEQEVRRHLERKTEIARLVREQARDAARHPSPRPQAAPSGKTLKLARSSVAPDRDGSSFLRERSQKRHKSRNARNTRATYGAS